MKVPNDTRDSAYCIQPQVMLSSVAQPEAGPDPKGAEAMPRLARAAVRAAPRNRLPIAEPFRSAEEAWFWAFASMAARHQGSRSRSTYARPRPCDPDDIVKCLDGLYRRRRIDLVHARILRNWGERGLAPNPTYASERGDWRLWQEAMQRLEWPLRIKGIVAG